MTGRINRLPASFDPPEPASPEPDPVATDSDHDAVANFGSPLSSYCLLPL